MNSLITLQFSVVILAGGTGRSLQPLTNQNMPKCLLPVANRTLLSYQLEFVSKVGFKDVFIVTTISFRESISNYIEMYKQESTTEMNILLTVVDDFVGTAVSLLQLKDKIKGNFIVMGGDLIVEDTFVHHMADLHRAKDAAVTILTYEESEDSEEQPKKGPNKRDKNLVLDYIGIDQKQNRLVYMANSSDLISNHEEISPLRISKHLARKFPNFTLNTHLRDAHFYIFSKWVLDVIEKNKQFIQNIKTHLIPFLVKSQRKPKKVEGIDIPNYISNEAFEMSSSEVCGDKVLCLAWTLKKQSYCARVTNLNSYMTINREIASGLKPYKPLEPRGPGKFEHFIATTTQIHQKTQIPSGCVIGDSTSIGERVGVKKSIIGKHCVISNNAKVMNSVLMNHVNVGDGAKIQNCIIGANSYIDENATVTDTQVGEGYRVNIDGEKIPLHRAGSNT